MLILDWSFASVNNYYLSSCFNLFQLMLPTSWSLGMSLLDKYTFIYDPLCYHCIREQSGTGTRKQDMQFIWNTNAISCCCYCSSWYYYIAFVIWGLSFAILQGLIPICRSIFFPKNSVWGSTNTVLCGHQLPLDYNRNGLPNKYIYLSYKPLFVYLTSVHSSSANNREPLGKPFSAFWQFSEYPLEPQGCGLYTHQGVF